MKLKCTNCSNLQNVANLNLQNSKERVICEKCKKEIPFRLGKSGTKLQSSSELINVRQVRKMLQKRVLVADDSRYFREVMKDQLLILGHEPLLAADGAEAMRIVKREMPNLDLLILDLEMPLLDGFDVLKEIRSGALGKELPILCTSSIHNNTEQVHQTRDLGANGFLNKTANLTDFVARIKLLLKMGETA